MEVYYITVHNTANLKSTAQNERDWLSNPKNISSTGWHLVVDAKEAIEAIPLDEVAYHAGDGREGLGNSHSIGVEICEIGDYAANEEAAVELIASLLIKFNLSIDRVMSHYDWNGKNCPNRILPYWSGFTARIAQEVIKQRGGEGMEKQVVPQWQKDACENVCRQKAFSNQAYWMAKVEKGETATWGEVFGVLARFLQE